MKIAAKQTQEFLNKPDTYLAALIYGPDEGQVLSRSRQVITAILGDSYDAMNLIELNDAQLKEDEAKLADECSAMSLMGGRRLIWLRNISEKHAPLIESCAPLLGPDCYLLASAGECGPRHKIRQLFEQHKQCASMACYRAEGRNLSNMIRDNMAAHHLRIDPDALQFLTQELGNDAMITDSELEKLSLYAEGKNSVSLADAEATTIHNNDHRIDPLCQYFTEGNQQQFDALWQHLIRNGEQPIVLIRSLMRHISRLLALKLAMGEEGYSADEAVRFAKPPIFWNQKDAMTRALNRLSIRHLVYYLHLLNRSEYSVKSQSSIGHITSEHIMLETMKRRAG